MERDITLHYNIKGEEPVELLHAMETRHYFPAHFHRGWCVNMLYRGERPFVYQRESFIQHPEQIVLINPGDIHEAGKDVENIYSMYHITFNDLSLERQFSLPANTEPRFTQAVVDDVHLAASIRSDAEKLLTSRSAMGMEELQLDVIERLKPYLTGVNYPEKIHVSDSKAFLRVRDYINDNLFEDISLLDISDAVGYSVSHVVAGFKETFGMTPHAYLVQLKIKTAQTMIDAGKRPADVATELNFFDQSHFIRAFKKTVGVTPNQYALEVGQFKTDT